MFRSCDLWVTSGEGHQSAVMLLRGESRPRLLLPSLDPYQASSLTPTLGVAMLLLLLDVVLGLEWQKCCSGSLLHYASRQHVRPLIQTCQSWKRVRRGGNMFLAGATWTQNRYVDEHDTCRWDFSVQCLRGGHGTAHTTKGVLL